MEVYGIIERAVARAAEDEATLLAARARWVELAGAVFDDEPLFEERAAAFLEWFLIDWTDGKGRPPIATVIDAASGPEQAQLRALAGSHRGLFVVTEASPADDGEGTQVALDDLWGGASFRVHERRRISGLDAGEVFEGRLVADVSAPPRLVFARTFCFHPQGALAGVRHQVELAKAAGDSRDALLFRLLRLRLRCERYRHVSAARIYQAGERETEDPTK